MANYGTFDYLSEDYPRTLFPLDTTLVVLQQNLRNVSDHIYHKVLNSAEKEHSFLSQTRCYSSKHGLHLRRTVKLDPVAEFFIYDLVYRNKNTFRKDVHKNRRSFGYRFEHGRPVQPTRSYGEFREAIIKAQVDFDYGLKCDVAAYFNSLYHHDLVSWFSSGGRSSDDALAFGQFLREANTGRSVDCLPHGIHPCKVLGADFLKFVDNSNRIRADVLLRFMDDFYLFSNSEEVLNADFLTLQRLLGEKALSLNAEKTEVGLAVEPTVTIKVDNIKKSLLQARRRIIEVSGQAEETTLDEEAIQDPEPSSLSPAQIGYLLELLKDPDIDEADAELVLILLRERGEDVLEHMNSFLQRFPSLSRNVYSFSKQLMDKEGLGGLVLHFLKTGTNVTEDQLFWLAKAAQESLAETSSYSEVLLALYQHPSATTISQAKVLEIPETRFGMPDLREEHLRAGKSDWSAWASAVGTRANTPMSRNHLLKYFAKGSPMNRLIADAIKGLP